MSSSKRIILWLKDLNSHLKLTFRSHLYVNITYDWLHSLNIFIECYFILSYLLFCLLPCFSFHFLFLLCFINMSLTPYVWTCWLFNISFLCYLTFLFTGNKFHNVWPFLIFTQKSFPYPFLLYSTQDQILPGSNTQTTSDYYMSNYTGCDIETFSYGLFLI